MNNSMVSVQQHFTSNFGGETGVGVSARIPYPLKEPQAKADNGKSNNQRGLAEQV